MPYVQWPPSASERNFVAVLMPETRPSPLYPHPATVPSARCAKEWQPSPIADRTDTKGLPAVAVGTVPPQGFGLHDTEPLVPSQQSCEP